MKHDIFYDGFSYIICYGKHKDNFSFPVENLENAFYIWSKTIIEHYEASQPLDDYTLIGTIDSNKLTIDELKLKMPELFL